MPDVLAINSPLDDASFPEVRSGNGLDLRGGNLTGAQFKRWEIHDADLSATNLTTTTWELGNFYDSDLEGADLAYPYCRMVGLSECALLGTAFCETALTECRMRNPDFNSVLVINIVMDRCLIGQTTWSGVERQVLAKKDFSS